MATPCSPTTTHRFPSKCTGVVLLTEPGTRLPDGDGVRLLIAFPNANSGAVAYFNATQVRVQRCTNEAVQLGMGSAMGCGMRGRCAAQVALPCRHLQHTLDALHVTNTASVPPDPSLAALRFQLTQGPSRDLIVELDNTTLTSTAVDGSVGLTVRCAAWYTEACTHYCRTAAIAVATPGCGIMRHHQRLVLGAQPSSPGSSVHTLQSPMHCSSTPPECRAPLHLTEMPPCTAQLWAASAPCATMWKAGGGSAGAGLYGMYLQCTCCAACSAALRRGELAPCTGMQAQAVCCSCRWSSRRGCS